MEVELLLSGPYIGTAGQDRHRPGTTMSHVRVRVRAMGRGV
mgnify:CR=1 FL=1